MTLLRNLQVELPERLRDRVRTLPFQVAIQCELQPIWQGSKTEDCVVTVQAETPTATASFGQETIGGPTGRNVRPRGGERRKPSRLMIGPL